MLRWIGIALFSFSWLVGMNFYHDANPWAWAVVTALGVACLAGSLRRVPARGACIAGLLLMAPAALWLAVRMWPALHNLAARAFPAAPWPPEGPLPLSLPAAVALGIAGLLCFLLPIREPWRARLGSTGLVACAVLLVQSLVMFAYEVVTSRSHELPPPLPEFLALVARALGMEAAADGSSVVLHSMRQVHAVGATWDLFLDPATVCLVAGGMVFIALRAWSNRPQAGRGPSFWKPTLALLACTAVWLPVRAGIQMGLYLHLVLRTAYEERLQFAGQFWNVWLMLGLVLILGLAAGRVVRVRGAFDPTRREPRWGRRWPRPLAALLVCLGAAALGLALFWDPVGERKAGRVMVDEYHSDWESTERAFDTEWYDDKAAYNYACIYDYCTRFFDMKRVKAPLTDRALADCDVLIIKCPTFRLAPAEVEAVLDFVRRGGGLILIGEHTTYKRMGTHLNDISSRFGFTFRYDCLFVTEPDETFEQVYHAGMSPHPILNRVPQFEFAVSASIAPGASMGRSVIRGRGVKSLGPDYHAENFYPQLRDENQQDRPDSRYGAFTQMWTTRYGAGRVVAWADSTVFSNFSMFEPGKSELMLDMIEWANRRDTMPIDPRLFLVPAGLVLLFVGLAAARDWSSAWVVLIGAALTGWVGAMAWARADHLRSMPPPRQVRPMVLIVNDRSLCNTPISKSGFIGVTRDGFGIFERWVLRLGYFLARGTGPESIKGDLVTFLYPRKQPTEEFLDRLVRYVESGGKVLVVDSHENRTDKGQPASSANRLLERFGISLNYGAPPLKAGTVEAGGGLPAIAVESATEVRGGETIARLDGKTVAATVRRGRGFVTVIGFGKRFTDSEMGVVADAPPNKELRKVFDFEFGLFRALIENKPLILK